MRRTLVVHYARLAAPALLVALILLGLAWELVLAPVKPGGSWLVLKVLPLLAMLRGILHGRPRAYQGSTLLIVFYAAEGVTRAYTDGGLSARLAALEAALAFAYFGSAVAFLRARNVERR
jgi:uncharacterized membrane protein